MIWFSSDTHFNHANIIKYSNRPFVNVEEMNSEIIRRFNQVISPSDTLYFLGDFVFTRNNAKREIHQLRWQLKCERIHYILGNHDKTIRQQTKSFIDDGVFLSIQDVLEVKDLSPRVFLSHYAHRVWPKNHYGTYHLYGHSHGSLPDDPNSLSFDVGVDTNDFYPYSRGDVQRKMSAKQFVPVDHHTGERD